MRSLKCRQLVIAVVIVSSWIQPLPATAQVRKTLKNVTVSTLEELTDALENLRAGSRIKIAPGTYQGGLIISDLTGAEGEPIVITASDEDQPPVFEGGTSCLQLQSPRYVELRHLVFSKATGNGLNIDDGGNADRPAHDIVLRNIQVHDVGPRGNHDGIKLSGVERFVVEECSLQRWGDGGSAIDMVGCHQGEIRDCEFTYRNDIAGNGVQTKGGSSGIVIKRCRFDNAGSRSVNIGGSTGRDFFRPNSANYEAKDITVEDCTFIGSMTPVAYVGVDGATVQYNTIYRPAGWVIRILQENQEEDLVPCRNGSFKNNLIAFRSDELRTVVNVGKNTAPQSFQFAKNHWFCIDNPQHSNRLGLPVEETDGSYGQNPEFADEEKFDLRLKSTSPIRDAGVRPAKDE